MVLIFCFLFYFILWQAINSHHSGERRPSVHVRLCRSSETALSFSGVCSFCSVTPVAAHPLGEVAIVILVVIHNKSRQEPEGHDSPLGVFSSLFSEAHTALHHVPRSSCCKSDQSGPTTESVRAAPADLVSLWLTGCSTTKHCPTTLNHFTQMPIETLIPSLCVYVGILRWTKYRMQSFCLSL